MTVDPTTAASTAASQSTSSQVPPVGGHHHHHHHGGASSGVSPTSDIDALLGLDSSDDGSDNGDSSTAVAPTSSSATDSSPDANLASLASALGTDPTSLLSALTSGQDLTSLFSSPGETGYGSSVADSVTGGVSFDQQV